MGNIAESAAKSKRSVPPHVRFYAGDWFTGVAGLKADERGVYVSMCVHIWTTGQRVPLDDAEAARRLCLQFNLYQRVRDNLLRLGKIARHADGYGNDRAEFELARAAAARSEASETVRSGRAPDAHGRGHGWAEQASDGRREQGRAAAHSDGGSAAHGDAETNGAVLSACQGSPIGAHGGACQGDRQITEQNQRPSKELEPITKNQTVSPESVAARPTDRPTDDFVECKSAFNGTTEAMLAEVQRAMGALADRRGAETWLATVLRINGHDAVTQAFAMLATARAEGRAPARVLPWWSKTSASLKAAPPAKPKIRSEDPFAIVVPANTVRYAKPAPGSEWVADA